jgi:LuxR family transcriptional regulator of csgAB operon
MESNLPLQGHNVIITGPRQFNNALIAFFLEREGGAECTLLQDVDKAAKMAETEMNVILWDVLGLDMPIIQETLSNIMRNRDLRVAMFDVNPKLGLEKMALTAGIKGFFYIGDPLPSFLKGMNFISQGELWVSRKIMERALLEPEDSWTASPNTETKLTEREIEILRLILQGARNAEIADSLCISLHTVKAHIYNTFKKIKVSNRIQAARWAAENLGGSQ